MDELQGCELKSSIDVKAGFNNVRLHPMVRPYCGVVTQDGLFVYNVLMFGFH